MALLQAKHFVAAVGSAVCLAFASSVQADTAIAIDVNTVVATATGSTVSGADFDTTFTGTLDLSGGTLADIDYGTVSVLPDLTLLPGAVTSLSSASPTGSVSVGAGSFVTFSAGAVTGGTIILVDDGSDGAVTTYTTSITGGIGSIATDGVSTSVFRVQGLTNTGSFASDSTFAGVDVSAFTSHGTFGGAFTNFSIGPFSGGSATGNLEVAAVVPTPGAALAAIPMLGVLGLRRRRRQD